MATTITDGLAEPNAITFTGSDIEDIKPVTLMPFGNPEFFRGELIYDTYESYGSSQHDTFGLRKSHITIHSSLYGIFRELADQWKADTLFVSSLPDIENHEAYRSIIGLGPSVIPLVLDEMVREPNWWFMALESLVDDPPEIAGLEGDLIGMTSAWVQWGEKHGYVRGADYIN